MPIINSASLQAYAADPPVKRLLSDMVSFQNTITAAVGGGQANATQLTNHVNRVTAVATAADSVKLPQAVAGTLPIYVTNAHATNSMNVFPSTGDAINALGANAAFAVAAGVTRVLTCAANGQWHSV